MATDSAGMLPYLPARRFCRGKRAMPSGHASTSAAWAVPKGEPGTDEKPLAAAVRGAENRVTRPDQRFGVGPWGFQNSATVAELRLRRHVSLFLAHTGDRGTPDSVQC